MKNLNRSVLALLVISIFSCTTTHVVKTKSTRVNIGKVNLIAVSFRRPETPVAETDDFTPGKQELDCMSASDLWKDQRSRAAEVNECLNAGENDHASYFYMAGPQPYLQIDTDDQKAPACLKKVLPKIELPREVYYLADQTGSEFLQESQGCYSSSFSSRTNELMKTQSKWLKKRIQIPVSPNRKLKNWNDLSLWLMVTTFDVLKSDEQTQKKLWGAPVPELICRACFKHDALFEDKFKGKIKPVFWP